jgi:choline dehydrogenase
VGRNLQDHLDLYIQYECEQDVTLFPFATWRRPHLKAASGVEWFAQGTGVCASNHFEAGGFIRTRAGIPHPDLQVGGTLGLLRLLDCRALGLC